MAGRDLRLFITNHRTDEIEKLTLRMKDGLSSKKYKSVDYEQLHALSEAKRQAAANTEYKIRRIFHAAKTTKDQILVKQHRQFWFKEQARLMEAGEKADLELQDFLQRDGINKDFFLQMEDYVQALDDDRKSFKAGTVHPIWQLKDDLQYKMMEMKSQASQKTDDFDCQVILEQVEFVKEQQNKILGKLKSEWIAVEEDIKETTVEDLLSAGEEIPSDVDQIPEQVFFMPCPYPELKASLMNEFQALGEKYKSRLQSINERLEAMDRYCGWSKEDHFVFQVTVDQYPHNQQNSRALCMDMLQRFLPHKSRQELNDHQRAWDWYYFTTEQKKTLLQGWIRDKQDLVMKAVMTIKEACAAYEEEEALRNDRKRQQEICAELKEKLEQWRAYQEEVARLEAAIAARKQEEAEEKLRKEKQKETQKRTQDKARIKQYYTEKQMQRDAMEQRDQQQLEELKKRMAEQAIKDKERVQFRHHLLQQHLKEREEQALRRQQEEDDKKKRLDALRNQVAVEAEFDPVRMMGDTEASKAKVCTAAENEFVLQKPLFNLHTYNENQILSDPRLRIEQALRDAGLHNTLYAKDVLSQITPPKPPRKGLESSVFQT
ncbi:coiled-coil domain-containing protein 148-like [Polypterus senegalus]|uniref:coiled-coil domain-containing protein 148-like n=1 Tax=Polypterus senegalus TaxID=55291 RepID=UPI0019639CE1|nr:coiled-coil domain-containing protein 148-like [Polypterus senegalus]